MILIVDNHPYHYEMQRLVGQFFPLEKITVSAPQPQPVGDSVYTGMKAAASGIILEAAYNTGGKRHILQDQLDPHTPDFKKLAELAMGRLVFRLLAPLTGISPPWGTLTGIRPVKLLRSLCASLGSSRKGQQELKDAFLVSPQKLQLAMQTKENEDKVLTHSCPNSFSLYISIPFCPSRCSYCSFISQNIAMAYKTVPQYVNLLCRELAEIGRVAASLDLKLETVYFGGGTPTSLEAPQLAQIMQAVAESFDLSASTEYTVEAGRPDTITPEKLAAIRQGGAKRISVNPQTFHPQVLAAIGRGHTIEQFYKSFEAARRAGFDCINIDLIAGLPGDSLEGFQQSIENALALVPENITLHTLSIKRAADLGTEAALLPGRRYGQVVDMVDYGHRRMEAQGYLPYYLYRQRNTAGNLENTGFCLPGHEGLYNVFIMDETHSILAAGAGGVTKLKHPETGVIERIYNCKYPFEYISRFEDLLQRKNDIIKFYTEF